MKLSMHLEVDDNDYVGDDDVMTNLRPSISLGHISSMSCLLDPQPRSVFSVTKVRGSVHFAI